MADIHKMSKDLGLGFSSSDYPHAGLKRGRGDEANLPENSKILRGMHINVNHSWSFWEGVYGDARDDIKFAYKEQWEENAKRQRIAEGRPVLSPNLIPQYINRIAGVARQSKFSVACPAGRRS